MTKRKTDRDLPGPLTEAEVAELDSYGVLHATMPIPRQAPSQRLTQLLPKS